MTVGACLGFMSLIMALFLSRFYTPRELTLDEYKTLGAYFIDPPRQLAEFKLIDDSSEVFLPEEFAGKWNILFFGFTYCPDVCPTTMSFLAELKSSLDGTEAESTDVVMVSVDPARDTVEQLATYVPYFHSEFLGVTGDFPDILSFARRFNSPFRKVTTEDGSYQMDHSANVVLINPKGDFHGFFRAPLDLAKMKVTLRSAQYYWNQQYD